MAKYHPNYRPIEVSFPDGSVVKVMSTYRNDKLTAHISPADHPAWNLDKVSSVNLRDAQVQKFNDKHKGINFDIS